METGTEKLLAHRDGACAFLTFNNPLRRNALSSEMWRAIVPAMKAFDEDPEIRVVVLSGAGEHAFIAGADISQFENERQSADDGRRYDEMTMQAYTAIAQCSKPTIARIHGFCMGGGVAIALSCDLRIASEDARFAIPAARLGISYPHQSIKLLLDAVGPAHAKEILFTARQYAAHEALHMGLVNQVVPGDMLNESVHALSETIAANAPLSVKAAKHAVNQLAASGMIKDVTFFAEANLRCYNSEDYAEGRRAFLEKRPPAFQGR